MNLLSLIIIPIVGIFLISYLSSIGIGGQSLSKKYAKQIALIISIINLFISLVIFISFRGDINQFQFTLTQFDLGGVAFGMDGQNIFFVLLTTIIVPIVLLSNWYSIKTNIQVFLILILLTESLLLATFLVVDILFYYIFFESTLIPLFLLIGMFGSVNRVRASYYLFLYTLFGSLFMLLSILLISSTVGTSALSCIYKVMLDLPLQLWLFSGIFLALAVKTPFYGCHSWLLKAHVEAPTGVSILLAAIVLKLSLYGFLRIVLPILPEATVYFTPIVYTLCIVSIIYGSLSTLRVTDIKEIVAYSSVCHASVYILGVFSNTISGIEGAIVLGLAHGFCSSGLFICVGGVLYERTGSRNIFIYKGIAQVMPIFSVLFLILTLANCGTPLTLNFVGEFLSLYGAFERLPLASVIASSSIVFSAAYSIYLFNRIAFGGSFRLLFEYPVMIFDLTKREFFMLFTLVFFTVVLGIYPSIILDSLHYSSTTLIYICDYSNSSFIALSIFSFNSPKPTVYSEIGNTGKFGAYSTSIFSADEPQVTSVKMLRAYENSDKQKAEDLRS